MNYLVAKYQTLTLYTSWNRMTLSGTSKKQREKKQRKKGGRGRKSRKSRKKNLLQYTCHSPYATSASLKIHDVPRASISFFLYILYFATTFYYCGWHEKTTQLRFIIMGFFRPITEIIMVSEEGDGPRVKFLLRREDKVRDFLKNYPQLPHRSMSRTIGPQLFAISVGFSNSVFKFLSD